MKFTVTAKDPGSGARVGLLNTGGIRVRTPVFMPVGTQGSVKALGPDDLRAVGARIVLGNAYHLYLRPGVEVVMEAGGLRDFMSWDGLTLTDSGGYQVMSLAPLRVLRDDGVVFRSHIDGSEHLFTPESVARIQHGLGADIVMPLDECPPYPCSYQEAVRSLERTTRWAERFQKALPGGQAAFGIVQGSVYGDLREHSVHQISSLGFAGYALGGLRVGEPRDVMKRVITEATPLLPEDKPRYFMGVGAPEDILASVGVGADMFDSVYPTRNARHGNVLTFEGRFNLKNLVFERDYGPLEKGCDCYACLGFSRAYLRHLLRAGELLALRLLSLHNLRFMFRFMEEIIKAIEGGHFDEYAEEFLKRYWADSMRG